MADMNTAWERLAFSISGEESFRNIHPSLSLLNAAVLTPGGAPLDEGALETIRRMRYYMDEADGLVLYSYCVGAMVHTGSIQSMLDEAAGFADDVNNRRPRFEFYNMDDGGGLALMNDIFFCYRPYEIEGSPIESMDAQWDCLVALESSHPIAVVYHNSSDQV